MPASDESELRRARRDAGRSLRSVAAEIPVDPAYYSRVERGLVSPSDRILIRALEVLGAYDTAGALRDRQAFVRAITSAGDEAEL